MNQNPFSVYDFLGYFDPGSLSIYLVVLINNIKNLVTIDVNLFFNSFPELKVEGIFIAIILSYTLGHILSYISSITIERYAVLKYGYPSKFLLNLKKRTFWQDDYCGKLKWYSYLWRFALILFIFPLCVFDIVFGEIFRFKVFFSNKLDELLRKLIIFKINNLGKQLGVNKENGFKEDSGVLNDFNRIISHYVYENSLNHQSKLSNYIALYGFLRTMNMIFVILFWYIIGHNLFWGEFNSNVWILLLINCGLIYIFFMSFMKFYRRYTLEGFMILASNPDI